MPSAAGRNSTSRPTAASGCTDLGSSCTGSSRPAGDGHLHRRVEQGAAGLGQLGDAPGGRAQQQRGARVGGAQHVCHVGDLAGRFLGAPARVVGVGLPDGEGRQQRHRQDGGQRHGQDAVPAGRRSAARASGAADRKSRSGSVSARSAGWSGNSSSARASRLPRYRSPWSSPSGPNWKSCGHKSWSGPSTRPTAPGAATTSPNPKTAWSCASWRGSGRPHWPTSRNSARSMTASPVPAPRPPPGRAADHHRSGQ